VGAPSLTERAVRDTFRPVAPLSLPLSKNTGSMKVQFAGMTDVGLKRGHNEDSFLTVPDCQLYLVADGMGGHSAGEVASRMAGETVEQFYRDTMADEDVTWPYKMDRGASYDENRFATSVKLANLRIHEQSHQNAKQKNIKTTFVGLHIARSGVIVAHVGDSRCYRIRDGRIDALTEDHSLLNDYKKMKDLTEEEIANFPHKNVIVRALGMKENVQVDVVTNVPQSGDIYLLCSDGLCGLVEDPDLLAIVEKHRSDLNVVCAELIRAANAAGGNDNITAVVVSLT
jgi:serine/threonine protein phosphatase PrpC